MCILHGAGASRARKKRSIAAVGADTSCAGHVAGVPRARKKPP